MSDVRMRVAQSDWCASRSVVSVMRRGIRVARFSFAGEAFFRNGRVYHALVPVFVQQALADLVSAVILRDLLTDEDDVFIACHFLVHGLAQGFAVSQFRHGVSFKKRKGPEAERSNSLKVEKIKVAADFLCPEKNKKSTQPEGMTFLF